MCICTCCIYSCMSRTWLSYLPAFKTSRVSNIGSFLFRRTRLPSGMFPPLRCQGNTTGCMVQSIGKTAKACSTKAFSCFLHFNCRAISVQTGSDSVAGSPKAIEHATPSWTIIFGSLSDELQGIRWYEQDAGVWFALVPRNPFRPVPQFMSRNVRFFPEPDPPSICRKKYKKTW